MLVPQIAKSEPLGCTRYVEVFGGGASVLLSLAPHPFEAYNDYNGDLVNMFRCIKDMPLSFIKAANLFPLNSRQEFKALLDFLNRKEPDFKNIDREIHVAKAEFNEQDSEQLVNILTKRTEMYDVERASAFYKIIRYSYGSGGKTIGEMLAKDLGIHCYNREIIRMASEDSGISEILFNRADERVKRSFLFGKAHPEYKGKVIPPESDGFVSDKNLFNYQAKIIRELAERESCVIIGRAADYVLKDYDNVVRVYVHASKEYCIQQTIERRAYVGKDVERFIAKTDKYRSDYYRYYTGREWTDARNYDLCLNSECLGFDKCVEAVKAYIKVRFGGLPQGEKE